MARHCEGEAGATNQLTLSRRLVVCVVLWRPHSSTLREAYLLRDSSVRCGALRPHKRTADVTNNGDNNIRIIYATAIFAVLFVLYGQPIEQVRRVETVEIGESEEVKEEKPQKKVKPKATPRVVQKAPAPKPAPQTYPAGCELYRPLVEKYNWDVRTAMAVMRAESGCNPNAANWNDSHGACNGSFGLFQLACFWTTNPHNPATNVAKAHEIYSRSGWSPWGVCTNGSVNCGL